MYEATIKTDEGKELRLGYDYGILFDITPISGANVTINTTQGFAQIGETVESLKVGGINRTIKGTILNDATAQKMLSILPAFTTGKLYINNSHYCDITVKSTPAIVKKKSGKLRFSITVFCSTIFWNSSKEQNHSISSNFQKTFSFPTSFDTHSFAEYSERRLYNLKNSGDFPVSFVCVFSADRDVENYGLANMYTGEIIKFDDILHPREKTKIYTENGQIKAEKIDEQGNSVGFLGYLSDDSNFFTIPRGDNIVYAFCDDSQANVFVNVTYRNAYMGVVV